MGFFIFFFFIHFFILSITLCDLLCVFPCLPLTPFRTGIRNAYLPGKICPQVHIFDFLYLGDEDCLYINVYVPTSVRRAREKGENTPLLGVKLWIYGGAWIIGDGDEFGLYDGHNIALSRNHVVVTFNYRLGALGFMSNDALRAESPFNATGNYALLDQIKALEWVQRNIEAFGGDKNKVTIEGESAGAFSVCAHLASPRSKGLFSSAIMESGTCDSDAFFIDYDEGREWSNTYIDMIGCNSSAPDVMKCVRELPTGVIMGNMLGDSSSTLDRNVDSIRQRWKSVVAKNPTHSGWHPLLFPLMSWGAVVDGVTLLDIPLNQILSGEYNRVPLIAGSNNDEGTIFTPTMALIIPGVSFPVTAFQYPVAMMYVFGDNSTLVDSIVEMYPLSSFDSPEDAMNVVVRDYIFACPTRRALRAIAAQGENVWMYRWDYRGDWIEDPLLGDYHTAELEFVWANSWPPLIHLFSENDVKMAETIDTYWANFINTHDPNGNSSSSSRSSEEYWPSWNEQQKQNIVLAVPTELEQEYRADKCDFWDSVDSINRQGKAAKKIAQKQQQAEQQQHAASSSSSSSSPPPPIQPLRPTQAIALE